MDLPWDVSAEHSAHPSSIFPVLVDSALTPQACTNSASHFTIPSKRQLSVFWWRCWLLLTWVRRWKVDVFPLWLWLCWPNPDGRCIRSSRSFSYQHSTVDWTGVPGCVLLTDQQDNWNLLEVQLSLSSSFLSCVPDWPSLPFYWAWQQLSSKRHWWEYVVAHTISLPAPMDNLNSCDPTLKCQH